MRADKRSFHRDPLTTAEALWSTGARSRGVEIIESCARQQYPLTSEGDRLGFEQPSLAGSLRERPVGADDAMPRRIARIGAAQHVACKTRRARRNVAIGTDVAWGDRAYPPQDRGMDVTARLSCHAPSADSRSQRRSRCPRVRRRVHVQADVGDRGLRAERGVHPLDVALAQLLGPIRAQP